MIFLVIYYNLTRLLYFFSLYFFAYIFLLNTIMGTCVALNKKKGGQKAQPPPKKNIRQKKINENPFEVENPIIQLRKGSFINVYDVTKQNKIALQNIESNFSLN